MSGELKVLIADDHPLIIAGIRRTIDHVEDMDVVGEAQSGAELVQLIERRRPDIVLMDLRMPGVTGIEMIELIRQRWPETKTVVLSACDDAPVIDAALKAGASAYVLKTAGSLDITSVLRQAANGEVLPAPVTLPARPAASDEPGAPALTERERDILSRGRRHDHRRDQPRALGLRAHDQVPPHQHLSQARRAQPRRRRALRAGARAGLVLVLAAPPRQDGGDHRGASGPGADLGLPPEHPHALVHPDQPQAPGARGARHRGLGVKTAAVI